MQFARVKQGKVKRLKHRGTYVTGDVCPVTTAELYSFGDKLDPNVQVRCVDEAARLMHRFALKTDGPEAVDKKGDPIVSHAVAVVATGKNGDILVKDVLAVLNKDQLAKLDAEKKAAEKSSGSVTPKKEPPKPEA